ncbi:DUF305 domain-containing protein [Yonghaparkia sp. Root332]|uniref:DUF305 domain-containing protein n=1 Tax=Yonghaparkia sp. Root332 TaxID=1736516 RepID=UPI0006F3C32D|nr:DUF305 domain-containing protein [Yonghaparkia sp. Root332]KQV25944.1 hypothetical protein ASC54_02990 [Yonghaparkia sp. Root332]
MTRTTIVRPARRRASAAAAIAGAAALALALAGCVTVNTGGSNGPGGMPMGDLPDGVNQADAMFTMMMIPHHEQAVEMSELVLGRDDIDPEIVALAEEIIAAQDPEIELMEDWLDDWGVPSMPGAGHGGGHGDGGPGGMMSDDDLDAIEDAQGDEAELLYLEGMIEHHEGAIDMAQDVLDDGESTEVAELADTIIETQQVEIDLMRDLIADRS